MLMASFTLEITISKTQINVTEPGFKSRGLPADY